MDENRNVNSSGELSGFDSVNPNDKEKEQGYTVTPQGGFFTPADDPSKTPPVEAVEMPASAESQPEVAEAPQPAPSVADFASESQPVVEEFVADAPDEKPVQVGFLPNGTYGTGISSQPGEPSPYMTFNPRPQRPKREKKRNYTLGAVVLSVVLAAIVGAGAGVGTLLVSDRLNETAEVSSQDTSSQNTSSNMLDGTVTNITVDKTADSVIEAVAEKAGPSVVGIRTTAAVYNFFGGGNTEATGEGSGVIYTSDGYIITNYHVIESAVGQQSNSKIEVFLSTDQNNGIAASIVGYNVSADLAVLKINKTGLPAIELGNSDELKVGQFVTAIGSPGGLQFMGSVSYGIISGLNRNVSENSSESLPLIQTDAAINPGNSGGALLNTEGQIIGVNSVKIVSEEYEGMGFAIPINTVKEICDSIIAKENDPTPYIGITVSERYDAATLQMLGYPVGAVVQSVMENGPADESGIQRGDIITEFNGKEITSYELLNDAVSECSPGDSVTVVLYRSGRSYSTTLKVGSNNAQ